MGTMPSLSRPANGAARAGISRGSAAASVTTRPSTILSTRPVLAIGAGRCAMTMRVWRSGNAARFRRTWVSVSRSSAEVASSRIRMGVRASKALASAIRWRSPPDSVTPRSPTTVSYPVGRRVDDLFRVVHCGAAAGAGDTAGIRRRHNGQGQFQSELLCPGRLSVRSRRYRRRRAPGRQRRPRASVQLVKQRSHGRKAYCLPGTGRGHIPAS